MPSPANLPMAAVIALFFAACVGHLALMVASHNWWYGQAFSKQVGDRLHLLHGMLFAVGPLALWVYRGWDFPNLVIDFQSEGFGARMAGAYLVVCWLAAGVALPLNTLIRLLRRRPRALVAERSEVIDFVKILGHRPAGRGKRAWLTALPFNDVFKVEFVEKTLCLPRVPPAWNGLTILHLTDLHLCGTPDLSFFRALMDRCIDPVPDVICLTGDIADSYKLQRWIVPILGRLRWNLAAFAIFGNHDYWYDPPLIRRRLKRLGIRYLGNGWEQLDVRGEPLIVMGNEYPWQKPAPDFSNCPAEPFRLCLSHTPDNIRRARQNHVDLMLCGHVHGGQVRLPLFGSILVPSTYGRRYDCGTFDEGPTLLHVGRGISGEHPLRFRCKPEVTRLVLRSSAGDAT
jgi:predicted MPP superfamily phosphohydrolase